MDLEKMLTQVLIALFAVVFFVFASRVKRKIENRYRKLTDKIEHSKVRLKEVSAKQAILCKKVMCEITNRHHRSIIAASLKQTLEEEMKKLETIKDSVKIVKQIPDVNPSIQQFERDFFPDFDNGSVFDFGSKDGNRNRDKKWMAEGDDGRIQTKLCKAWRNQSRKLVKHSNDKIRKNRKENCWNDFKSRRILNDQLRHTKTNHSEGNMDLSLYNTSIGALRRKNFKITRQTPVQIMDVESSGVNDSMKILFSNNNKTDGTDYHPNHNSPFSSCSIHTINQHNLCLGKVNNQNVDICLNSLCENGTLIESTTSYFKRFKNNNLDDNEIEKYSCLEKTIKQKNHVRKEIAKQDFQFDLIYCNDQQTGTKIVLEHIKNKNYIFHSSMENSLKVVDLKMFQFKTKKYKSNTSIFMRYIFKISLKIDKKRLVLKCVLSCYNSKCKRVHNQLGYRAQQKLQSYDGTTISNCCKVNSKHKSFDKKPPAKRHSLYTNTSMSFKNERNSKSSDEINVKVTLAEGDIHLVPLNNKNEGLGIQDKDRYEPNILLEPKNLAFQVDRSILKQCVGLTKDCLKDSSGDAFSIVPEVMYHQLSTIEEEIVEDRTDYFKNINEIVYSNVYSQEENSQDINELGVVDQFHRTESMIHQVSLDEESNLETHSENINTNNKLQTRTSFTTLDRLELEDYNWLRDLNNCKSSNYSSAPTGLSCIFEFKSYADPSCMSDVFLKNFYDVVESEEETISGFSILQNGIMPLTNNSFHLILDVDKNENEENRIVLYNENADRERTVFESEARNSFVMSDAMLNTNDSNDLSFNVNNTSSSIIIFEGAMFSSTDNSCAMTFDENKSTTDLSDYYFTE